MTTTSRFTRYFAPFLCVVVLIAYQQAHKAEALDILPPELESVNAFSKVELEVAATQEKRVEGLQNRRSLLPNAGMLFIFDSATKPCFWMKDTLIPLSIGFINELGVLTEVQEMQPNTLNHHCPQTPIKYAVEMNQGWFAQNKIVIGTPLFKVTNSTPPPVPDLIPINAFTKVIFNVADTPAKKEQGLQNQTALSPDAAMLFVLDTVGTPCFWMKNTTIPLSIGFIDVQGVLVQVEDMQPLTQNYHCARTPVKYAVEMHQGWFSKNNTTVGTTLFKTKLVLTPTAVTFINAFTKAQFEIADTPAKRARGLQDRTTLATDEGMFYIMDTISKPCFINSNPSIPLSVGLIDAQGVLIQVENMPPSLERQYCAQIPIKYAAELNHGWFTRNQILIGTPVIQIRTP